MNGRMEQKQTSAWSLQSPCTSVTDIYQTPWKRSRYSWRYVKEYVVLLYREDIGVCSICICHAIHIIVLLIVG